MYMFAFLWLPNLDPKLSNKMRSMVYFCDEVHAGLYEGSARGEVPHGGQRRAL